MCKNGAGCTKMGLDEGRGAGKCPKWLRLGQENWNPLNSTMFRVNLASVWPQGPQKRGGLDFGFVGPTRGWSRKMWLSRRGDAPIGHSGSGVDPVWLRCGNAEGSLPLYFCALSPI